MRLACHVGVEELYQTRCMMCLDKAQLGIRLLAYHTMLQRPWCHGLSLLPTALTIQDWSVQGHLAIGVFTTIAHQLVWIRRDNSRFMNAMDRTFQESDLQHKHTNSRSIAEMLQCLAPGQGLKAQV